MDLMRRLPNNITRVCLDLDDVLVDFEGAVEKLMFGSPILDVRKQREFWLTIGSNKEARDNMWGRIREYGADWWAGLDKLPWFDDLWEAANRVCDNVIILSSPGDSVTTAEFAAQGKIRWSMKEFGHNNLCLTSLKYMCACKDVILIDDLDKFIEPWTENGGFPIKLRKRWEHKDEGYSPDEIISALNKFARK